MVRISRSPSYCLGMDSKAGYVLRLCYVTGATAPPPPVGQDFIIHEVSRSHTTTHHSWQDSSGRVIGPPQRPLPNNTQHRQQSMPPVGFEPTISASERPQTYTLEPRPRTPCSAVLIVNILPLTYPQLNVNSV